ncbi:unnamed protein product [Cochlearia groenlandica]
MRIIAWMFIAIIILLTSIPAKIKVAGAGSVVGGGSLPTGPGSIGASIGLGKPSGEPTTGYRGGLIPVVDKPPPDSWSHPAIGDGYRGGSGENKPMPGGDTGPAIVVIPKPIEDEPPKKVPMPRECKSEVRDCITKYVIGAAGWPKYKGPCCEKLKNSVPCVCKFLLSEDTDLKENGVIQAYFAASYEDLWASQRDGRPKANWATM